MLASRSSACARAPAARGNSRLPTVRCNATAAHEASTQRSYYVVQNVFKVKPESATDFEEVWKKRESHLKDMPGFVRFAMLRCENIPGKYVSQSTWETKEAFEAWTKSGAFQASHSKGSSSSSSSGGGGHGSGGHGHGQSQGGNQRANTMSMLEGPPAPEMYSAITVTE